MQVKNRRQEKVCVSNLNFAFFKKEQKGKEQKERVEVGLVDRQDLLMAEVKLNEAEYQLLFQGPE